MQENNQKNINEKKQERKRAREQVAEMEDWQRRSKIVIIGESKAKQYARANMPTYNPRKHCKQVKII